MKNNFKYIIHNVGDVSKKDSRKAIEMFPMSRARDARKFHRQIPDYNMTPLVALPNLAQLLGLGGIYIGFLQFACALNPQETKRMLGLRPDENLVCTLALGYPNVDYVRTPPRRKRDVRFL